MAEVCIRIAKAAKVRMNLAQHHICYQLHVLKVPCTSNLLFRCEKWTLLVDMEKRIQAFKNKCLRSCSGSHTRNIKPMSIVAAIGRHQELLTTVKQHKGSGLGM